MKQASRETVQFTVNDQSKPHFGSSSDPTDRDTFQTLQLDEVHTVLQEKFGGEKFTLNDVASAIDTLVVETVTLRGASQIVQTLIGRGELTQCPHSKFKLATKLKTN